MAGQHGGPRKGGGRKKGATNIRTRQIADQMAASGAITPLEVMLDDMAYAYHAAKDAEAILLTMNADVVLSLAGENPQDQFAFMMAEVKKTLGLRAFAQECAKDAAPYMHPRLQSIEMKATVATHEAALKQLEEDPDV